jgi:hypothetical protein
LPFLVGGLVLGVVAIVLIVLGLIAFSSASSARDERDRLSTERRSAEKREIAAQGEINTVVDEGNKVGDQVGKLVDAANQVTDKGGELTRLLEDATGRFNAGDESGANAMVNNQGRPILSDEQRLKAQENQSLTEAQDAQNKLREALSR